MILSYSAMAFCSLPCCTNFSAELRSFALLNPNPSAITEEGRTAKRQASCACTRRAERSMARTYHNAIRVRGPLLLSCQGEIPDYEWYFPEPQEDGRLQFRGCVRQSFF